MEKPNKLCALFLSFALLATLAACDGTAMQESPSPSSQPDTPPTEQAASPSELLSSATVISLSGDSASIGSTAIEEFDYTWHCDPSVAHDEVKNAPAEYYTGTKPDTDAAAYIDHELYYFPELPAGEFRLVNYDGEREWAYYYTDGENNDFIFATLPNLGNSLPTQMMHSEAEAAAHKVLHITRPGVYALEGSWKGQIRIDLGDEDATFADENAKVTLILNGVDIECDVAPGIVFYSAYECDNEWESRELWSADVDTSNAGVTVVIADGSENTVTGTNIYRMLKTKYKNEDSTDAIKVQKKMRKLDGAFYSYVTMNIEGEANGDGTLTVNAGFEGIDSELHLSFNGGNVVINSQDDGVNVNEDYVSVVSFNGGNVVINAGLGAEGDGVDSNGYIVIDGCSLSVNGIKAPDSALDSESGIYYKSGTVIIDGEEQSYTLGETFRESGGFGGMGGGRGGFGGFGGNAPDGVDRPDGMRFDFNSVIEDFDIVKFKEQVAALDDSATLSDVLGLFGIDGFDSFRSGMNPPDGIGTPGGMNPPEKP